MSKKKLSRFEREREERDKREQQLLDLYEQGGETAELARSDLYKEFHYDVEVVE
jgi:hypothetical protein